MNALLIAAGIVVFGGSLCLGVWWALFSPREGG